MDEGIAVFDLAAFRAGGQPTDRFAVALASACENAGGFCIRNSGMGDALMASVRKQTKAFFDLDEEIKSRVAVTAGQYSGYISPDCSSPLAVGVDDMTDRSGLFEGYRIHLDLDRDDPIVAAGVPLYGANVWPPAMLEFQRVMRSCFDALCTLSLDVLRGLAVALRVDPETFVPYFENPLSTLALMCRQRGETSDAGGEGAVRPHRDSSAFTILLGGCSDGMEIQRRDGTWTGAPVIDGVVTVVIGNMMEAWSGGRLQAGQHRLTGRSGAEGHRLAFSAVPNYGTVIRPLPGLGNNYRPVHVGPYMEAFYQGRT